MVDPPLSVKTAAELLQEERGKTRLSTGIKDLDELTGGVKQGRFYLFYGKNEEALDALIHRILVNCTLKREQGGFDAQALYFNNCNYHRGKTILDPSLLATIAKNAGKDPKTVFRSIRSVSAFNEAQQLSATKEIVNLLEEAPEIRLIVAHNISRFIETSRRVPEAVKTLRRVVAILGRAALKRGATLVVSCGASKARRDRIPGPQGGIFLRRKADVAVFLEMVDDSVKACLVKHPSKKTPHSIVLHTQKGGIDLMGRITPSFRQSFQAQIKELRKHFQKALVDPEHRKAFDNLLKEAWFAEGHALASSQVPSVLDAMNLMANVHNKKEVEALKQVLEAVKERVEELEEAAGRAKEVKDEK